MVVDDAAQMRLLLRAMLVKAGHRVVVAESGPLALEMLQTERPALIVVDFMMPIMDGPAFISALREQPQHRSLPVLMLTATQEETNIEAAFSAGADDYMTKPVERRILTARVDAMIRAAEDHARADSSSQLDEELREATRFQQARLPAVPAQVGSWVVAGGLVASRHIGGDFFDIVKGPDGAPILALVDISGHGLAAALLAGSVANELRSLTRSHPLAEAMRRFNSHLWREGIERYACVAVMALHADHATIINAGLPPVCLVRDGKCLQLLSGSGTPPGMLEEAEYDETTVAIAPGDRLIAMSDGLTEPFGAVDAVGACIERLGLGQPGLRIGALASETIIEQVRRLLEGTGQPGMDDATLVIAQAGPTDGGKA
jgi:sigma-B regulation protein RsbU (phosphoserine phosphatase)